MNQGSRDKNLMGKNLSNTKQPKTPYTDPNTVPWALTFAALNVAWVLLGAPSILLVHPALKENFKNVLKRLKNL